MIAFLQKTALQFDTDLESVKPVFSSQGGSAKTRVDRLLVHFRSGEQGMRAFLNCLEEAPMPWRIEDIQISADGRREGGVGVHLSLEKMKDAGVSLEEIGRYLGEEGLVMKTSKNAPDPGRTFFRPPAEKPGASQEKNALAVLSDGWRLVGILQGADSRAVIEERKGQRVFTVRPGDAVGDATVGPIGADGVLLMMDDETLRLTFQ